MNKVSRKKNDNFTIISNVFLRDKELSIKAKGFLAVVMGLPDSWEFTINGICQIFKEGKTSIYNIINELKEKGYCKTETCRNDKGVILGVDYSFFEEPNMINPSLDNPCTENPSMGNQPQLSTNKKKDIKDKENNKDDIDDFVEKIYKMYPTKCPKRNKSLGKGLKDKTRIKNLLKFYSMEDIERVVKYEIETKYQKDYMSNFSTFLNNFPDPTCIDDLESSSNDKEKDNLIIGGVEYQ